MTHEKIKEMLGAYFDGQLRDSDKVQIEQHLKTCQECQKELADLEKLENLSKQFQYSSQDEAYWNSYSERVAVGIKNKISPTRIFILFNNRISCSNPQNNIEDNKREVGFRYGENS